MKVPTTTPSELPYGYTDAEILKLPGETTEYRSATEPLYRAVLKSTEYRSATEPLYRVVLRKKSTEYRSATEPLLRTIPRGTDTVRSYNRTAN